MHTDAKALLAKRHTLELQAYEHRADLGGTREHGVRKSAVCLASIRDTP